SDPTSRCPPRPSSKATRRSRSGTRPRPPPRRAARRSASCAISTCPANGGRCSIPNRPTALSSAPPPTPQTPPPRRRPLPSPAQPAVRGARGSARARQGLLFPQVDAAASAFRGKPPIAGPLDNSEVAPTFNLFTTALNVSYSPDVFGGTRRSIEQLAAQEDQQ